MTKTSAKRKMEPTRGRTSGVEAVERTHVAVVFGIPIDNVSMDETVERVAGFIDIGRFRGRTHQITTVNVDFLVNAVELPDVRAVLERSDLNLADGMPVVWASSWLGTGLSQRVAGADLVPRLLAESALRGWRIHFFGGSAGVAEAAERWASDRYPGALVTFEPGPMIDDVDDVDVAVIESIRAIDADIVCVGLGNPKQERFIATHAERIGAPLMIGIGGTLQMLTGDKKRAPKWVQNTGLEWIFRAAQEPRRLGRRYVRDVKIFAPHIARYVPRARRHLEGSSARVVPVGDGLELCFGDFDDSARFPSWRDAPQAIAPATIRIDCGNVESIDPRAHSELIALLRLALANDSELTMTNKTQRLAACLDDYGTLGFVKDVLRSQWRENGSGPTPHDQPWSHRRFAQRALA